MGMLWFAPAVVTPYVTFQYLACLFCLNGLALSGGWLFREVPVVT